MRKITRAAADAFINGRNFNRQNMTVLHYTAENKSLMMLHGNLIAVRDSNGLRMTLAGWNTPTTRERLNGLLSVLGPGGGGGMRFYQHDFAPYFGTRRIESDEWITIT